jgi:hypothetical protein
VVVAVHVGYVDTDATRGIHAPKVSAAEVAEKTSATSPAKVSSPHPGGRTTGSPLPASVEEGLRK